MLQRRLGRLLDLSLQDSPVKSGLSSVTELAAIVSTTGGAVIVGSSKIATGGSAGGANDEDRRRERPRRFLLGFTDDAARVDPFALFSRTVVYEGLIIGLWIHLMIADSQENVRRRFACFLPLLVFTRNHNDARD